MPRPWITASLAAAATVLAAELLLRMLPVSGATMTGYYEDPDLLGYPAHHAWTVSTGWDLRNAQRLKSNNAGFAARRDFVPDPRALALIGDSFVEAASLAADDRPADQLERALRGARPVYGLGSPGTALLDYAQRVRWAHQRLGIRDFVIWVEPGDVRQAVCGSGHVVSRCLDAATLQPRIERLPEPDVFKRVLRHSALAQYTFSQLKADPAKWMRALSRRSGAAAAPPEVPAEVLDARARHLVDVVVAEFYAQAGPHLTGRVLFLMHGRAGPAHKGASFADGPALRRHLVARLREHGAEVLDLEEVFVRHMATSRLSPEIGPYDPHLNALGVGLVMRAAAERMAAW